MVWNKLANKYDRLWVQRYSLAPTRREVIRRIGSETSGRLLDVGCGTGQLISELMAQTDLDCVGIDKSYGMVQQARRKGMGARFFRADISEALPKEIEAGGFDFITCTHSFPYYPDKDAVLRRIAGLLAPDGRVIFVQASINNTYDEMAMAVIEKTAEKADYLSKRAFMRMARRYFTLVEQFELKERWFMPSICGFVLKLKGV